MQATENGLQASSIQMSIDDSYDDGNAGMGRCDATFSASTSAPSSSSSVQHSRPLDAPGLTSLIKRCQNARSLQKLVCLYSDSFNVLHVGAACTQLVRIAQQADLQRSAHRGYGAPPPGANSFRRTPTRQPSSEGRDALQHTGELLLDLVASRMQQMAARQRANTAWALSKWPSDTPRARALLCALLRAFEQDLDACQAAEMSMALYASAYAAVPLAQPWLARLSRAWGSQLGQLKVQELSNVLWALGQQAAQQEQLQHVHALDGVVDGPFLAALLREQHQRGLHKCAPQELLQSLQGLALLQVRPRCRRGACTVRNRALLVTAGGGAAPPLPCSAPCKQGCTETGQLMAGSASIALLCPSSSQVSSLPTYDVHATSMHLLCRCPRQHLGWMRSGTRRTRLRARSASAAWSSRSCCARRAGCSWPYRRRSCS